MQDTFTKRMQLIKYSRDSKAHQVESCIQEAEKTYILTQETILKEYAALSKNYNNVLEAFSNIRCDVCKDQVKQDQQHLGMKQMIGSMMQIIVGIHQNLANRTSPELLSQDQVNCLMQSMLEGDDANGAPGNIITKSSSTTQQETGQKEQNVSWGLICECSHSLASLTIYIALTSTQNNHEHKYPTTLLHAQKSKATLHQDSSPSSNTRGDPHSIQQHKCITNWEQSNTGKSIKNYTKHEPTILGLIETKQNFWLMEKTMKPLRQMVQVTLNTPAKIKMVTSSCYEEHTARNFKEPSGVCQLLLGKILALCAT